MAAYAFDAKSGYFFEPSSAFYYDPKNKFYYNAHKQEYYHHTPLTEPPFTKFEYHPNGAPAADAASGAAAAAAPEAAAAAEKSAPEPAAPAPAAGELKPTAGPIVFGLPKKANKGTAAPAAAKKAAPAAAEAAAQPKPAQPKVALSHILAVGTDPAQIGRLRVNERAVTQQDPKTGKWLCFISRRQFADEAALHKHIAKSDLYKTALEKAANEGKVSIHDAAS